MGNKWIVYALLGVAVVTVTAMLAAWTGGTPEVVRKMFLSTGPSPLSRLRPDAQTRRAAATQPELIQHRRPVFGR